MLVMRLAVRFWGMAVSLPSAALWLASEIRGKPVGLSAALWGVLVGVGVVGTLATELVRSEIGRRGLQAQLEAIRAAAPAPRVVGAYVYIHPPTWHQGDNPYTARCYARATIKNGGAGAAGRVEVTARFEPTTERQEQLHEAIESAPPTIKCIWSASGTDDPITLNPHESADVDLAFKDLSSPSPWAYDIRSFQSVARDNHYPHHQLFKGTYLIHVEVTAANLRESVKADLDLTTPEGDYQQLEITVLESALDAP